MSHTFSIKQNTRTITFNRSMDSRFIPPYCLCRAITWALKASNSWEKKMLSKPGSLAITSKPRKSRTMAISCRMSFFAVAKKPCTFRADMGTWSMSSCHCSHNYTATNKGHYTIYNAIFVDLRFMLKTVRTSCTLRPEASLMNGNTNDARWSGGSMLLLGRWNSVVDAAWNECAKAACRSTAVWYTLSKSSVDHSPWRREWSALHLKENNNRTEYGYVVN